MFEHGISKKWLRRAQWAIYTFFGTFALGGLWYVFYSAVHREVFDALIGAGVVWGSIGLGIGMHCVTQMAAVVDANQRALADLHKRADAIQELLEQIGPGMNLSASGAGNVDGLVAAAVDDAFPRLVHVADGPDAGTERIEPDVASPPSPAPPASSAMDANDAESLRAAFREAVFAGDYVRALAVGDIIIDTHPDSSMARQFEALRNVLEARASSRSNVLSAATF